MTKQFASRHSKNEEQLSKIPMALPLSDDERQALVGLFCSTFWVPRGETAVGVTPDGSDSFLAFVRHNRADGKRGFERSEHGDDPRSALVGLYRKVLRQARGRRDHIDRELAAAEAKGGLFE